MQSLHCPHRTQKLCLKLNFSLSFSFAHHTEGCSLTSCKSEPEHGWRCLLPHKHQCESKYFTNSEEWVECFTFVICFCCSTGLYVGSWGISYKYFSFLKKKALKALKKKMPCETDLMTWSVKIFLWPTFYRSRKTVAELKSIVKEL